MIDLYVPKPIFIGMILNEFDIVVTNESPKYTVTYILGDYSGVCVYEKVEKVGVNKPIRQSILILTESNMGEVIDYWNLKSPLSEESYNEVSQTIRTHSRQMVEEFLQGPHQ
jgi:UDP-2,3-diacylglucosamine pyrophosphatase LpxH